MRHWALLMCVLGGVCVARASEIADEETCWLAGEKAILTAAKKGYRFVAATSAGAATCEIRKDGEILVVSATAAVDGECAFSLFVPPASQKRPPIVSVALRSAIDGSIRYLQRDEEGKAGFAVLLSARKGETAQYRVTEVELPAIQKRCEETKIGGQL